MKERQEIFNVSDFEIKELNNIVFFRAYKGSAFLIAVRTVTCINTTVLYYQTEGKHIITLHVDTQCYQTIINP